MTEYILKTIVNGTAESGLAPAAKAALLVALGCGTIPLATESVVESLGSAHKTVITLTAVPVTVANTTGISFGSVKLYDLPEGLIAVLGASANLTSINWAGTTIATGGSGDFSIGSTATADATLSTTDANIIASSAMLDPFVAGVGTGTGVATAAVYLNGTTTAADVYMNVIIDDADVADATSAIVLLTGTVTLLWVQMGDTA